MMCTVYGLRCQFDAEGLPHESVHVERALSVHFGFSLSGFNFNNCQIFKQAVIKAVNVIIENPQMVP